jgi:hypothetical protein
VITVIWYSSTLTERAYTDQRIQKIALGLPTLPENETVDPFVQGQKRSFIKLPRAWLDECNAKHSGCPPEQKSGVLPKRLICVKNEKKPQIIDTTESQLNPQQIEYIALSHKWRDMPQEATTTIGNIDARKKAFP